MGIHTATAGRVVFEGNEIAGLKAHESRRYREHLQYCYQDPGASLDPRWSIRASLHEPLIVHTRLAEPEREARVREILRAVGLPETHLDLYPHEISGGQQRRVGLARILTLKPSVVILDEPTSGLDVSVQATILNLFLDLQRAFGLTYLFISHDLSVVRMICDRVAVMYLGRVVEIGATQAVFETPRHPYTQSLLAAIPKIGGPRVTDTFELEGEPPSPTNLPSGCRFRTRCPRAQPLCAQQEPLLRPDWPRQEAACHFAE
jgi:oligopeptide/dipeptide ABC transporter ATP-binding protein